METTPSPEAIRSMRGARSRADIAALIGVTPLTVYRWELPSGAAEHRRPRGKVLERLRAWMQGSALAAPPARLTPEDDPRLARAINAVSEAQLEAAEAQLVERLTSGEPLGEVARALGAVTLAKVQLLARHDARGAGVTLLAVREPSALPRAVQLEYHLVTAFLHAHPDGRLFHPGKVHHHAALAEALLDAGDGDSRFFLWFVRYSVAVGIHEAALIARALDSFPAVRNLATTPLHRVLVAEAEALGSLTLTNLADAAAKVEALRAAADAVELPLQQARARSWRAEVLVEESAPPDRILELLDEAEQLLRRGRVALGIHGMHMPRNRAEALLRRGRLSEAGTALEEGMRASAALAYTPHRILNTLARLASYRGAPAEALRNLGERALEVTGVQRDLAVGYGRLLVTLAEGIAGSGTFDTVADLLTDLRKAGIWAVAYRHAALHALSVASRHAPLPAAERLVRVAERAVEASPSPTASGELRRLRATVLARGGRRAEARQLLEASIATFELAGNLPERALARWQLASLGPTAGPDAAVRLDEAVAALAELGIATPPPPVDDEGVVPAAVRYVVDTDGGDGVALQRLVVPIQRLTTRGAGAALLERELLNVVGELLPRQGLRLEEVDSNGQVTELGARRPAKGELSEWFELSDGAGRRLRLGAAGPLTAEQRSMVQVLVACAALALELSTLRGFNGKPHPRTGEPAPAAQTRRVPDLIAASPSMRALEAELGRLSGSRATIIVTGESGAGKEVVARALHQLSQRAQRPYVTFNAAAVPRDLFEGQLFGYRKGSFTGATSDHPGVIRAAEGGTLFLDEVGELPLDVQPKLLRFLENGEVFPLGERQAIRVDVRVIAATHRDLAQLVKEGRFREDLYYRLQVVPIRIPPLRERPEDILALARFFLARMTPDGATSPVLAADGERKLLAHPWPGNVRELRNVIERTLAFDPVPAVLTAAHLRL